MLSVQVNLRGAHLYEKVCQQRLVLALILRQCNELCMSLFENAMYGFVTGLQDVNTGIIQLL